MPRAPKTNPKPQSAAYNTAPTISAPLSEFTVDELARVAGSTVRNVRAYQDRGLLSPPVLRGRKGYYDDSHLVRLRLINQLLTRGYSLGNIQELMQGLEKGQSLQAILGLQRAIASPWSDEHPKHFTLAELIGMFGVVFNPITMARVISLGLLEPDGLGYRAPRPRILIAGAELSKAGIPLAAILDLVSQLRNNVERVADAMVQQLAKVLDRYGEGQLPPSEDMPMLENLVWRLRPLAMMAVESEVSRALERSANIFLDARITKILEAGALQPIKE